MNHVKKVLSIVLALVMVACIMPMSVFAAGNAAKIGTTEYATLKAAVESAKTGATITLLENTTVTDSYILVNNKTVTVDLAGYTLTLASSCGYGFYNYSATSKLTLKNGTINATNMLAYISGGSLTLNSCTVTVSGDHAIQCPATKGTYTITIDADSVINATGSSKIGILVTGGSSGGTINVRGKIISTNKGPAIQTNGSQQTNNEVINIYDGAVVSSDAVAIYAAALGKITVSGGLVQGYAGIGIKSGVLNISGGQVIGTARAIDLADKDSDTNGIAYDGSAIVIDSNNAYAGAVNINITGGEVKSTYAYAFHEIGKVAEETSVVSIKISGNAVISGGELADGQWGVIRPVTDEKVEVRSGTFSSAVPEKYCAEGFAPQDNGDGSYGVVLEYAVKVGDTKYETFADAIAAGGGNSAGNAITLLESIPTVYKMTPGEELYIAKNGMTFTNPTVDGAYVVKSSTPDSVTKYYTVAAKVMTTSASGTTYSDTLSTTNLGAKNKATTTVTLLSDMTLDRCVFGNSLVGNATLILDLNEHTITMNTTSGNKPLFTVAKGCTLDIKNGNIVMSNTSADTEKGFILKEASTLTLEESVNLTTTGHLTSVFFDDNSVSTLNTAANITSIGDTVIQGNGTLAGSVVNITGGKLESQGNTAIYQPQDGELNISGGEIVGYASAIELRAGTLNITGGILTALAPAYSTAPNGDGSTTVGAAVAIAQHNTKKDITVSISNATLNGAKSVSVADPNGLKQSNVEVTLGDATYNGELAYSAETAVVTNDGAELTVPAEYDWYNDELVTTTDAHLATGKVDEGGLMGHQDKTDASGVGRTIIGLTSAQLSAICASGEDLVIIGGDKGKQTTVSADCAYTYFYNGEEQITAESVECAAFIILDCDADSAAISGYGYYRIYSGTTDNFLFDVMYANPNA